MIAAASVQAAVARPLPGRSAPGPALRALILLAAVVVVGGAASRGAAAGAIAIAAIGFGLAVLRRPAIGAICLVAVVPAVAGLKRGLPVPGLRPSELLIIGGSALVLAAVPRTERTHWRSLDRLAVAYAATAIVVGLLATALRDAQLSFDDWGQLLGPVQFVLLYRAAVVALDTPRLRGMALDAMLAASIPVSLLAMLQAARFGPVLSLLSWMTGADFADRQGWALERVSGPFPHWTVLGGYEVAVIALAAAVLLSGRRGRSPAIAMAALVLGSIALTLTVTIGSIVGAIVAVLLLARWSNRLLLVGGVLALAGVVAGLAFAPLLHARAEEQFAPTASRSSLPLVPSTVAARYDYWTQQYLPALRGHWLTGYGPQIPDSVQWRFTESVYLAMIMRGGLPLLVLYLALMWAAALVAWRSAGSDDDSEGTAARVVFVLVVALALMQITAPQFVLTGLPHLWWGLLGVLGAAIAGRPARGLDRR